MSEYCKECGGNLESRMERRAISGEWYEHVVYWMFASCRDCGAVVTTDKQRKANKQAVVLALYG